MLSDKNCPSCPGSFMEYIGHCLDNNGGVCLPSIDKLVNLMKNTQNKLVPKYLAIAIMSVSATDVQMKLCESGVWNILFQWLQDGLKNDTTCFIIEILQLYLKLPITFENLTSNACPKLIKKLTKNGNSEVISIAKSIVSKWKKVVEEKTKSTEEVPCKKIKLDKKDVKNVKDDLLDNKKKLRTVKVRTTNLRTAGVEDIEPDQVKPIQKKPIKKGDEKPSVGIDELHQKVSAATIVDKRKVIEIHESKNFINSITQNPVPLKKKKKRQEPTLINKSVSDISLTEESMSDANVSTKKPTESVTTPSDKPRKRVSWAPADNLQSIKYFELDENERVNVNKVSMEEMKKKERMMERQHVTHKFINDDNEDDTQSQKWYKPLIVFGIPENKLEINSAEQNIQLLRERKVLKVFYFSKDDIPYSAAEPENEPYDVKEPKTIPLEDIVHPKPVPKPPAPTPDESNSKLLIFTEKEGKECQVTLRPDVATLLKSITQSSSVSKTPILASVPEPVVSAPMSDQSQNCDTPQTRTKLISIIRSRYPDIDPEKLTSEEVCKLLEPLRDQLIREGILSLPPTQNVSIPPPNFASPPNPPWFPEPRPYFPRLPPQEMHNPHMMHQRLPPMPFPARPCGMPLQNRPFGPPRPMRQMCRFLANTGYCRSGINCTFSHILPPDCPPRPYQNQNRH